MKRLAGIILTLILIILTAFLPVQQTAAPDVGGPGAGKAGRRAGEDAVAPREVRALWVVRHILADPEAVHLLVERARANGFTDLIVQVRGRGDAYYNSPFEPRAEELDAQPGDFDPLAQVVAEGHLAGLRIHAWLNTYLVSDIRYLPKSNDHLIYRHPDWLMVPRGLAAELYRQDPQTPGYLDRLVSFARENPTRLEGLFISPANGAVRDQLVKLWLDVATRYDVDGLHFDYVRYPNPEYDFSRPSLDRFRDEMERLLPVEDRQFLATQVEKDPLIHVETFPEQYAQFQRRQVNLLVQRIYQQVKSVRPELKISAAVFANETDAARSRFQDWKHWLQRGWLDAVCPMAYTPDTELYGQQIATAVSLANGREVWSGIGAYRQAVDEARAKILLSRELGARGFILFSYNSLIETSPTNQRGDYLEQLRPVITAPADSNGPISGR